MRTTHKYAIENLCILFAAKTCAFSAYVFYKFEIQKGNIMHSFDNIKSMLANAYLLTLVLTHTHKYASCVFIQKYVHAWAIVSLSRSG